MPEGVESADPMKYRAFLGTGPIPNPGMSTTPKEAQGEKAAMASTGTPVQHLQGSAATRATEIPATGGIPSRGPSAECDPTHLCEALALMTNSLEYLEEGYFSCFSATVEATREVLADLSEVDITYVNTVLEVMKTWHATVDGKCNAIDEATMKFGKVCEASQITHAKACEDQRKAIQKGDAQEPVVELLDRVLEQMREAANIAVAAFQKQFQEALLPHVPVQDLPMLVSVPIMQ